MEYRLKMQKIKMQKETNMSRLTHVGQSGTGSRKVRQSQTVSSNSTQTQAGQYIKMSTPRDHQESWKDKRHT